MANKSNLDFASPIPLVTKKNARKRLYVDFRTLNRITAKKNCPLPLIHDQLERLRNKKYFTILDHAHGYYQVPLTENSQLKIALITPGGRYEFT